MKLRGVNLGGWLVLERWMTPTLFEGTNAEDEYTFMQLPSAREKLRHHQQTFITDEDFKWMSRNGVNAVRVPVGYWIFDGDPPYLSCIGKLDWAFAAAKKYDIQVLISLHGAPGSQNGMDHSGRKGKAEWYRQKEYRAKTIDTLERLAERYRSHPQFWGIELLNEPHIGIVQWKLRRFYNAAYRRLIAILPPSVHIVYHDAFTPRMLNAAIWDHPNHPIMIDIHWYHFINFINKHISLARYYRVVKWHGRLIKRLQRWQGVIIGEWSGVIAGEILDKYPQSEHMIHIKDHIARQLDSYREANGWFYWNYKTEHRGLWHFRSMVEDGNVPEDWSRQ